MSYFDVDNHGQLTGKQEQEQNRIRLFLAIYNHKWLTAKQLGVIGWPKQNKDARRVSAFRFIKTAIADGLLLDRKIEKVGGTIAVLSHKGALWMLERGYRVIGADKWGNFESANWSPPSNYFHDFMINEFLTVELFLVAERHMNSESYLLNDSCKTLEYRHINERELKKTNKLAQVPDGLFWDEATRADYGDDYMPTMFIECESYRKTGAKMRKMMTETAKREKYDNEIKLELWLHPIELEKNESKHIKINQSSTIFIYDVQQRDERGFKIDHRKRLISAFRQLFNERLRWDATIGKEEITLYFAPFDSKTMQFLNQDSVKIERPKKIDIFQR
jgi:hypothetical protein